MLTFSGKFLELPINGKTRPSALAAGPPKGRYWKLSWKILEEMENKKAGRNSQLMLLFSCQAPFRGKREDFYFPLAPTKEKERIGIEWYWRETLGKISQNL